MGKRKTYDWEAIEREYRAGQLSIREIARQHGCSAPAITQRAKRHGWRRDLTAEVRKRVNANLVNANINTSNATDEEIIKETADQGAQVIHLHRKDIAALRELEASLIREMQEEPTKLWIGQYQGEIVEKVVGLTASERAQAANNLANVQHKRIALERQAFNLDEPEDEGKERVLKVIYEEARTGEEKDQD